MALLDKKLIQRIVGALVLIVVGVIVLPRLFDYQGNADQVGVNAPEPQQATPPEITVQPTELDELGTEPVTMPEDWTDAEVSPAPSSEPTAVAPPVPSPAPAVTPPAPPQPVQTPPRNTTPAPAAASGNWSVQLASLTSRSGAEKLRNTLRSQGYNAYLTNYDDKIRVMVGPVKERAEADRLRDQINRQNNLQGFVVRYQAN